MPTGFLDKMPLFGRGHAGSWAKFLCNANTQGKATTTKKRFSEKYLSVTDLRLGYGLDTGNPTDGFVIQRPLVESATVESLRFLRQIYPDEKLVVSTWNNSSVKLLRDIEKYCDAVVTSALPKTSGGSNRNYQLVSTQAGLACARELGVATVVKMRTDMCIMAPAFFELARKLAFLYGNEICRQHGLDGRIIIPKTYTK